MVEINPDPDAGGNQAQVDDGRDADGRGLEPLDAAHWPPVEGGVAVMLPGLAPSQPAGTGPVLSTPAPAAPAAPAAVAIDAPAAPAVDAPAEVPVEVPAKPSGGLTTKNTPTRAGKPAKSE